MLRLALLLLACCGCQQQPVIRGMVPPILPRWQDTDVVMPMGPHRDFPPIPRDGTTTCPPVIPDAAVRRFTIYMRSARYTQPPANLCGMVI